MTTKKFKVIVLGCTGGPREDNASAFLLAPINSTNFAALDAGTILVGIDHAYKNHAFDEIPFFEGGYSPQGSVLRDHIKGYLITHAHLDHIMGLVINSQVDSKKYIYGFDATIDHIRDHIFNGVIWPNYGDEGCEPMVKQYHYVRLQENEKIPIKDTEMKVEAFKLSHPGEHVSTAFLIEHNGDHVLFFGDTAGDEREPRKPIQHIWEKVAPLWAQKKLRGIFIECSYAVDQSDQTVYGHLDSRLLMQELTCLKKMAGVPLTGLNIIVIHRKENLYKGPDAKGLIAEELTGSNDLGVHFIFPKQGEKILL